MHGALVVLQMNLQRFACQYKRSRYFEPVVEESKEGPTAMVVSDVSEVLTSVNDAAKVHTQDIKETIESEIRSLRHLVRAPEPRPYVDGSHNTELRSFKTYVQGGRCNLCSVLEGRRDQRLQLDHIFSRELLPLYCAHGWPLALLPTRPAWLGKDLRRVGNVYNGTEHDPRNIQAICAACHDTKTEQDRAAATRYRANVKERDRLYERVGERAAEAFWNERYAVPSEEDALLLLDQRVRASTDRASKKLR